MHRALAVLALIALALGAVTAAPFVPALVWALTLAIVAQPLQRVLARHVRRDGLRAGITTAVVAALVLVPAIGVVPLVAAEVSGASAELRSEPVRTRLAQLVEAYPSLAPALDWLRRHMPDGQDVAARVASWVPGLMSGSVWIGLQWLVAFFAAFYFLRGAGPMLRWLQRALPLSAPHLLALEGNWPKALVLVAWGAVVVGLIDNLLYPMLVSRKLRLHTLPVFIAILGGLFVFGASGLVIGPLVLAMAAEGVALWRQDAAS